MPEPAALYAESGVFGEAKAAARNRYRTGGLKGAVTYGLAALSAGETKRTMPLVTPFCAPGRKAQSVFDPVCDRTIAIKRVPINWAHRQNLFGTVEFDRITSAEPIGDVFRS